MLGRSSRFFGMALAALAVAGLPATSASPLEKALVRTETPRGRTTREWFGGGTSGGRGNGRRAGFGWTNRHAQRVATKKRNVARHRSRSRGRA